MHGCCSTRWSRAAASTAGPEFPKDVREIIARRGGTFGVVLMGLDGYILDEHLRLVDCVLKNNPGLVMRAVVSDSADSIGDNN